MSSSNTKHAPSANNTNGNTDSTDANGNGNGNTNNANGASTIPECIAQIRNLRETLASKTNKSSDPSAATTTTTDTSTEQASPSTTPPSSTHAWQGDPSAIASLVSQARAQHSTEAANLQSKSPRILVVGPSGSGKSSLINTTFGVDTATVGGGGRPITRSFVEHGPYKDVPIRLIDSRGLERGASYTQQCDEIVEYIRQQNANEDHREHVHIVWYVVGGRWEQGDIRYIKKLKQLYLPIIIVINKCDLEERNVVDARSGMQAKILLRDSIAKSFDELDIIFCGDNSKQLEGWEPSTCANGHSKQVFEMINNRKRTWYCGYEYSENDKVSKCNESGKANDTLLGYKLLSDCTMQKLPTAVNLSFVHAQKINLQLKNNQAIDIIKTAVFIMTGIAMTPIPFSDMPLLIASEGFMSVKLFTLYNIPVSFMDVTFFSALNAVVIGALGGAAKVVAGFLKASAFGLPVGVVVDMVVAASSGTAIGISIARVAQVWFLKGLVEGGDPKEFKKFVVQTVKEINFVELMKAVFQLLLFKDTRPVTQMIQANVLPTSDRDASTMV